MRHIYEYYQQFSLGQGGMCGSVWFWSCDGNQSGQVSVLSDFKLSSLLRTNGQGSLLKYVA